jgi:hypothetical protein
LPLIPVGCVFQIVFGFGPKRQPSGHSRRRISDSATSIERPFSPSVS